jgi:hypothetical protein
MPFSGGAGSERRRFRQGQGFIAEVPALPAGVAQPGASTRRLREGTDSSQANTFEGNEFVANRRGHIVAADAAADCKKPGVVPNVSRGDRFWRNPSMEQRPRTYGWCLR